jgi:transcriptional regulator with XRE-family HTH domain
MTPKQLRDLRSAEAPSGNKLAAAFAIVERSQMDCSRATGLTPQYITDVKGGRFQNISVDNARKFAEFFGCAIEDLFPAQDSERASA